MLEQPGVTAKGLVEELPRGALGTEAATTEGYAGKRPAGHLKHFRGFRSLKAGKRHA